MIRVRKDRSVQEHRAWRSSTTPADPVVPVLPDTRRGVVLMTSQLQAMGLHPADLRGNRNRASLERWWSAWTRGLPVTSVTLLNPQLAQPHALCDYLMRATEAVEVVLLERLASTDGYEAIVEELGAADFGDASPPRRRSETPDTAAPSTRPALPRVGTPIFIEAVRQTLPASDAARVEQLYRHTLDRASDHLQANLTPDGLYGLLQASATGLPDDDLRTVLHATQAACWRVGIDVRLDAERVVARAAMRLRAPANQAMWHSIGAQVDANRATAMGMAVIGIAIDDIVGLDVSSGQQMLDGDSDQPLPRGLRRTLRVALHARRADGAGDAEPLLMDPTGRDISDRSVGRWARVAVEDHLAPLAANNARWRALEATGKLSDLGIEWP